VSLTLYHFIIDSPPSNSVPPSTSAPSNRKSRSAFTDKQVFQLEKVFEKKQYIEAAERSQLSISLGMTETQVKTWFQNRRMKEKQKRTEETHYYTKLAFANRLASGLSPSGTGVYGYQPVLYPAGFPAEPPRYPGPSQAYLPYQQQSHYPAGYEMTNQLNSPFNSYPVPRNSCPPYCRECTGVESSRPSSDYSTYH